MKIYGEGTIDEWSRVLRSRYGTEFRTYSTEEETLERWQEHLSQKLGYKFIIKDDLDETLNEWSRLIGG